MHVEHFVLVNPIPVGLIINFFLWEGEGYLLPPSPPESLMALIEREYFWKQVLVSFQKIRWDIIYTQIAENAIFLL